jgi:hypothetical protein
MDEAIRQLELSVRLDNNFAPAHAQLAIAITLNAPTLEEAKRKAIPFRTWIGRRSSSLILPRDTAAERCSQASRGIRNPL